MEYIKIEWAGVPVLTSRQLAAAYNTKPKNISENFSRAKDQFKEGIHFFKLTGEPLRHFKGMVAKIAREEGNPEIMDCLLISPYAALVYLWTQQGAARHCKVSNPTAKAGGLFEK